MSLVGTEMFPFYFLQLSCCDLLLSEVVRFGVFFYCYFFFLKLLSKRLYLRSIALD